ncbi:hypothetical protein [Nonomuraea sp. NPDC005650]|uniref:hypothetical protein n=1 Tax=Nonomuraea sp. NPDC005650 TaxID=3157045 RepID=UPI0033AA61AE
MRPYSGLGEGVELRVEGLPGGRGPGVAEADVPGRFGAGSGSLGTAARTLRPQAAAPRAFDSPSSFKNGRTVEWKPNRRRLRPPCKKGCAIAFPSFWRALRLR